MLTDVKSLLDTDNCRTTTVDRNLVNIPAVCADLDGLMAEADLNVLLITSKHNVRYLLDGHECQFFQHMDAVGISRYLPVVVYLRGRPEDCHYIGWAGEHWDLDVRPIWVKSVECLSFGSLHSAELTAKRLSALGQDQVRIGVEREFLPADAMDYLRSELSGAEFVNASSVLEQLRACKTPAELEKVEECSRSIVDSMLEVFAAAKLGATKRELVRDLREAQTARGLTYEYCLVSMGADLNRGISDQPWAVGEPVSFDSGGQLHGYIGDVARMAVMGEPDQKLVSLLDQVQAVQAAARAVVSAGTAGREIFIAAQAALAEQPDSRHMAFVAHGMGLISHEAPRLTGTGPVRYPATHAEEPLQPGMVLSIETWVEDPVKGFIKLEDTLAVSPSGYRAYGDHGRGWNVAG